MRFIITSIIALYSILAFSQSADTIKIGLLVTDINSKAAINGAELAIRKANEKGGYKGRPFRLAIRSMEGPWGTGSKEAVSLIFDEEVWALMGSHDGRNAHLVEQAATKSRVVFLSAWASDPTLAQAFVPWYYTVVPTDLQQADALIEEIYEKRKINRIALISGKGYDPEMAMANFVKRVNFHNLKEPLKFTYDSESDISQLIDKIEKAETRAVVIFGNPDPSLKILTLFREKDPDAILFCNTSVLSADQELKSFEDAILISTVSPTDSKASAFRKDFQKVYGTSPGAVSSYAFDGMSILVAAIRNAGSEREKIQKYLSSMKFEGVTGPIQFDEKGKRIGTPELVQIKKGIPVTP
jgi:branched-chain amino acid transport system substrate-binding protein